MESSFDANLDDEMIIMEEATQPPTLSPHAPIPVQTQNRDITILLFFNIFFHCFFTSLHGMQTRSSDEISVCLSVCLSHA